MAESGNIGEVKFGVSAEFDSKGTKEAEKAVEGLTKQGGQASQAFEGLRGSFAKFEKTVESMTGGLIGSSTAMIGVGRAAGIMVGAAVATVATLGMMAKSASEAAAGIDILSQRTGINTTTLQEYSLLLNRNDVSQQQFATGMQQLAKRMDDLTTPTSDIAKAFKALGVEMGPGTPPDQAFEQIAMRIARMPDGLQKTAIVTQIFGRSAGELIPVMDDLGRGFGEAARRAHELGTVMSAGQIETLKKLDDTWDDFNKTLAGFTNNVGSLVAPIFTSIIGTVTDLIGKVSKLTQEWAKSPMGAKELNSLPQQYVDKQQALIDQRREAQFMPVMSTIASEMNLGQINAGVKAHLKKRGEDVMKIVAEEIGIGLDKEKNNLSQNESIRRGLEGMTADLAKGQAALQPSLGGGIVGDDVQQRETILALQRQSIKGMEDQLTVQQAVARQQETLYQQDLVGIDKSSAARRVAFEAAQQQHDLTVAQLQLQGQEFPLMEEQVNAKIYAADLDLDTKRRQIIAAYPTFFEQQMRDLVNSNTFSLGQISSNFTSATAQWIVTGKGFEQFWVQLQTTLVQAFLNTSIQWLARLALQYAQEQGLLETANAAKITSMQAQNTQILTSVTALETAKTAAFTAGESARLVIAKSTNVAMGAMMVASLASMSAMATAAFAMALVVSQAVAAIAYGAAAIMAATPFGQPAAGALIAATTGFEFATSAAIIAGTGAVQAALGTAITSAALGGTAFASGGIVTRPTMGLIGEAGASEAIIPLNRQGAGFMADMLGLSSSGRGQGQTISIFMDGAMFRRWILQGMPDDVRLRAGAIA